MATDVNFLSIFSAKHLSSLKSDGLLGLSPKSQFDENHLLVNELKKDGVIEKAMFSIYLTDLSGQSYMEFGSYNQSIISESSGGIFWMQINSQVHWQVLIYDARIGDVSL